MALMSVVRGMSPELQDPLHAMTAPISADPMEQYERAMAAQPMAQDTTGLGGENEPGKIMRMTPVDPYEQALKDKQMADLKKDENPYGSAENHPGFFGKLLHGLSVATGGPNRRALSETERAKEIQGIEKENSEQALQSAQAEQATANAGHLAAETPEVAPNAAALRGYQTAETRHLNEEVDNPAPQYLQTDQGYFQVDPHTHVLTPLTWQGQQLAPFQKDQADKNLQQVTTLGQDGKPHTYGVNTKGEKVVDYGVHYERPITINTGEKSYEYSDKALTAVAKPIEDLAMRMGRLKDTLAQGSPQADALVAPELLTVMAGGQGSGLRMNEAEIARVIGGRSAWQNLQGSIQHWATDPTAARSITPEQDRQIRALIQHVDGKMQRKLAILNDARSKLVDVSDANEQHRLVAQTRQQLQSVDTETGGTVKVQAPNGQVKEVPADQVEHYKSLGAKVVQ